MDNRRVRGYVITLEIEVKNKSKIVYNVVAIGDDWAQLVAEFDNYEKAAHFYNEWSLKNYANKN